MCNGARYGVPQPVIIFPLSPFLFLSFLLPTPYFSSVEYASNAFFATWRHACVCCTQIFSMVAYFRHSPRAHLTSTGKKTGEKKGKKKKQEKKQDALPQCSLTFPQCLSPGHGWSVVQPDHGQAAQQYWYTVSLCGRYSGQKLGRTWLRFDKTRN